MWDSLELLFTGKMAGEPGFEPGLTESESVVLPLDDSPITSEERVKIQEKRYKDNATANSTLWAQAVDQAL